MPGSLLILLLSNAKINISTTKGNTMAHALEEKDGQVAFALRGEPAWHGLANVLFDKDEHIKTSTMLDSAKLSNWNIQLEELVTPTDYRTHRSSYYVTRTNPFDNGTDILGVVGERYQIVQNEQLFEFGDNLLDGGASWESAGSIKHGTIVFGSLVIPKEFTLDAQGANDKTTTYLMVHTSHDGSVAVQASITPVRVVCQNTLNLALGSTKQSFKLRHTASIDGRIAVAREALGLTFKYMDDFEKEAKALFETSVNDKQFNDIITAIYPKPEADKKMSVKKWENKIDLINDIYFKSPTQENIKGNAWGVLNALTERLDYFRAERKGNTENRLASASGFDIPSNVEKNKLFRAVKELAGVK
jgi:phage/plasmid-like protein (TIGR03299 family)